ncbi:MAG: glycosyltransferase family 39 protein [Litorilinea sp.]
MPPTERAVSPPAPLDPRVPRDVTGWSARGGARVILASFLLLGMWFSLVIPPFETPDEHYHYAFARHLAQGNPLPIQAAEATGPWAQEGSQAPLYYWIVGRLTAGIDQRDFATYSTLNPAANLGDPLFPGNKNRMLYSAVQWPLAGANLALHVGRWFSVLLGGITLWALYATARLAFPHLAKIALLALASAAWLPQFVFLSASFTNDTLVIALASLTVYWLARLVARAATTSDPIRWWEWGVLGVLLGLAALSKLQGLGLWLLAALVGGLIAGYRRDWRVLLRAALPVAVPALLIAGWWYWRNITLYGDWTGLDHLAAITGARTTPLTWGGWWHEFRGLRYSAWGLFGWFNLLLPVWIYTLLDGVTLLALGGGVWTFLRRPHSADDTPQSSQAVRIVLWLWVLISAAALFYWISRAEGSQGRLIFPALAALMILLCAGLDAWRGPLRAGLGARAEGLVRMLRLAWPAFLLGCTLYVGGWLLPRAYAAPAPVAAIPADATPVEFRFGADQALHILAIDVAPGHYVPGTHVEVTLYMKQDPPPAAQAGAPPPDHPAATDYQLFIQFLDETGSEVGNLTTHPGWGRNPTTLWEPGAIYADTYPVRFDRAIADYSPLLARVYVGFVNPATAGSGLFPIDAVDRTGAVVDPPIAGHVVLHPAQTPTAADYGLAPVDAHFGEVLALRAAAVEMSALSAPNAAGTRLDVQLLWTAIGQPPAALTGFVHVLDEAGNWHAGYDAAPSPRFPTDYWQPGDVVLSEWTLDVPATVDMGEMEVWVGLYPAADQGATRLPVTQDGGRPVRHDLVRIR